MMKKLLLLFVLLPTAGVRAADYPAPAQGDFVIENFRFTSGEMLPELRLHYRTLGKPARDAQGIVRNAVLIMHGTGGSGAQFIRAEFAGELFGAGGLLDAARYFIVLPDGIGQGQSSKPSDGRRARFPHYGYVDMVEAQYRLLTEGLGDSGCRTQCQIEIHHSLSTWLHNHFLCDLVRILVFVTLQALEISLQSHAFMPHLDAVRSGGNISNDEFPVIVGHADIWMIRNKDVRVHPGMTCLA